MVDVARPQKKEEVEEGAPVWLLTYSDLVTQMLIFFVMLFSFSNLDEVKIQATAKGIREAIGGGSGGPPKSDNAIQNIMNSVDVDTFDLLEPGGTKLKPITEGPVVETMKDERGLKFLLGGDIAFEEGSAVLRDTGDVDRTIAEVIRQTTGSRNVVEVRGYTSANDEDAVPDAEGKPDHWTLGYSRAKAVADRLLLQGFDYRKLRMASGGMTDPREKGENLDRRQYNRRVEVIVTDKLISD
ncbi:MAG: flagellar motor protein MotB [Planctomycetota bacterium]|nr:flagellar motor protein MotB [Planctomycetota bacterium]